MLQQDIVKVFTTKQCVTIGRFHLEHTLLNLQDGYIKCSSTKIIHGNAENHHAAKPVKVESSLGKSKPFDNKHSPSLRKTWLQMEPLLHSSTGTIITGCVSDIINDLQSEDHAWTAWVTVQSNTLTNYHSCSADDNWLNDWWRHPIQHKDVLPSKSLHLIWY